MSISEVIEAMRHHLIDCSDDGPDDLVGADEIPAGLVRVALLDGDERRWGRMKTAVYAFQEGWWPKFIGVEWYQYSGDGDGDREVRVFEMRPVVRSVTVWEEVQ